MRGSLLDTRSIYLIDMTDLSRLNKAELCYALSWSKPTLDRWINAYPDFPVRTLGTQGGGWEFDLPVVLAYLTRQSNAMRSADRWKRTCVPSEHEHEQKLLL
jgi:hypothetical protein